MPVDLLEEYEGPVKRAPVDLLAEYEGPVSSEPQTSGFRAFLDPFFKSATAIPLNPLAAPLTKAYEKQEGERLESQEKQHPLANLLGNISGSIAGDIPLMTIPGYGQSKIARYATQGALQGGAAGALHNLPENLGLSEAKNTLMNALETGALSGAIGGGVGGITGALGALRPSRLFRGTLTPEQLLENARVTKGTETNLGEVVKSPFLKRTFENILPHIPGSGIHEKMLRNAENITQKGENLAALNPSGIIPEDVPQHLVNSLSKVYESNNIIKNNLYNNMSNTAESLGINLGLPNFRSTVNSIKEAFKGKTLLKDDEALVGKLSALEDSLSSKIINPATGVEMRSPVSISEANIFKSQLKDMSNDAYAKGNRHEAGMLNRAAKAIDKDIKEAIDNSGSRELKEQFSEAQEYYKNNIAPYQNKDIYKYISGKGDVDNFIQSFIKTGNKQDKFRKLEKLTNILPQEEKNLLSYGFLSKAFNEEGSLNPPALKSLINSLGKNQKKALFGEKASNLKDFEKLVGLNEKSFQTMFNPPTGQTLKEMISLLGGFGGVLAGYAYGGPEGALGALAAVPAAKYAGKKLTSEKFRENLIKKMIENDIRKQAPLRNNIPPYLGSVLSEQLLRGNE